MLEWIISGLVGVVASVLWWHFNKQANDIKSCIIEINTLKAELMKRSEIITHVDKEISKLKVELKEDNNILMVHLNRLDDKIDKIYELLTTRE